MTVAELIKRITEVEERKEMQPLISWERWDCTLDLLEYCISAFHMAERRDNFLFLVPNPGSDHSDAELKDLLQAIHCITGMRPFLRKGSGSSLLLSPLP